MDSQLHDQLRRRQLTVTPAPLTITADNQTKVYGGCAADPDGQLHAASSTATPSASLTTQPTLSTTATAGSHVAGSPYAITASGAVDANYTISYVAGTLTVTPAPLTITADNQTKVYGGGSADADGELHRLRQRRHLGQPDHPAHADARRRPPAATLPAVPTPSPPAAPSTPTTRSAMSPAR